MNGETLKSIKNFLLSDATPTEKLRQEQWNIMNDLLERSTDETTAESFSENKLDYETFTDHCSHWLEQIPWPDIRKELYHSVEGFDYSQCDVLWMNIGFRIKTEDGFKFEEWANILDKDLNTIPFSIHKTFTKGKYELLWTHKSKALQIEIGFDGNKEPQQPRIENNTDDNLDGNGNGNGDAMSVITTDTMADTLINGNGRPKGKDTETNNNSNSNSNSNINVIGNSTPEEESSGSVRYIRHIGDAMFQYSAVRSKQNNGIHSEMTLTNKHEDYNETMREELIYSVAGNPGVHTMQSPQTISTSNDGDNPINSITSSDPNPSQNIKIHKVTTETSKSEGKNNYYECNFETYTVDKNKTYDWHRINLDKGGYDSKVHRFLDDGCGVTTTESIGTRYEGKEWDHEYHDTNIKNISTGEEKTTKIGKDRINEWNQYIYKNTIKNINHVENKARRFNDGWEWFEKWYEDDKEKYGFKWGKSPFEEWEEEWKDICEEEGGDRVKKCYKKCKKLCEDKEWYETWTEKNNDKDNCEKTCYKMSRSGCNKYENYWGNIIVNYLDNKRMNYVGFVNNDDKVEYQNFTYENTNG